MTHGTHRRRRTALISTALLAGGVLAGVAFAAVEKPSADPEVVVREALTALTGSSGQPAARSFDGYTARDVVVEANGSRHVRFSRTYKGLPVLGGEVALHSGPDGRFGPVADAALNVATTPKVDAGAATGAIGKYAGYTVKDTPFLAVDALDGAPALVWAVRADKVAADGTPSNATFRVDAASGRVLGATDSIHTLAVAGPGSGAPARAVNAVNAGPVAGNGKGLLVGNVAIGVNQKVDGTYELKDPNRGNMETRDGQNKGDGSGPLSLSQTLAFSSATTTFGNNATSNRASAAVDAHYGVAQTWDYYKNVHGRNGIDGQGTGARSDVHYGQNYENAFWDDGCYCMTYGDGASNTHPLTELDVAGHEMSHGVTAHTAALDYGNPGAGIYKESGGINESTSDIFGTLVEFYTNNPNDNPDYYIGEVLDLNGNGTPLRYMDDPTRDGRSKGCWTSTMGTSYDPHLTSGVGNHFFFLAAVGSGARAVNGVNYNSPTCNNAPAVNGIGNDKAGKIWYRALSTYMVSTETYPKARISTLKATNDLYGGAECTAIKAAWTAVGVGVQAGEPACAGATPSPSASASPTVQPSPTASASPTPTGCAGQQKVANGGFEVGAAPWTGTTAAIKAATTSQPAHGGTRIAWLGGKGGTATESLSQQVTIPAGCKASLKFYLHIDTAESGTTVYDRFSVMVGSTTLGSYSNANKAAGYVLRTFDLSAYAGQTVTLKFTESEDYSLQTSFVVDDVSVTTS
ncbi:M4 family metallopeptidase [Longispora sp. K20-0274]|uniref:M4 family metallopeptidase n=1 Tax=Longispora sp. K20-0274 TaxID=3088255 RepID=UPI00399B0C2C